MNFLDSLLSRLTMYRLMLYYLIVLVVASLFFSGFKVIDILGQSVIFLLSCYLTNLLFSKILKIPTNFESFAITALILTLIIGPTTNLPILTITAFLAMASKYLLTLHKRHFFNPAAIAAVLTAILFRQTATWWVGADLMAIPIILGGLLILHKVRRFTLAATFLLAYLILNLSTPRGLGEVGLIFFFTSVMLIEPATSPVVFRHQLIYAVAVVLGFKFLPVPYSLELSLILGNLLTYLLAPTGRFLLRLEHKIQLTPATWAFYFRPDRPLNFLAGQYLELTFPHPHPDNRGTRRFFTIASSPTEPEIMLVSKFVDNGSSFKKALLSAAPGTKIFATGPAGEFVSPETSNQKLAFIAGGIGITPFRSMGKSLLDSHSPRDIILLYAAANEKEFVFKDLFPNTIYKVGRLESEDIKKTFPDFKDQLFYVSGPEPMVEATEKMLRAAGVSLWKIKRDYFPGYDA